MDLIQHMKKLLGTEHPSVSYTHLTLPTIA